VSVEKTFGLEVGNQVYIAFNIDHDDVLLGIAGRIGMVDNI
jgi:hypothetical protein